MSLFLITLVAYGQTLGMYFWIDDNALIYRLEHPSSTEGFWGDGLVGSGPYRHIVDQFVLFYPLFKTNPAPYYALGIIFYYLAAVVVYILVNKLVKNKKIAWASAAIFASGYVGSETIFGITNSWQTSRGVILSLVSLYFFIKYLQSRGRWFYIISVVLFFFALDTVFIRSPGLIFIFVLANLLFSKLKFNIGSLVGFFLRLLPFGLIHYYIYISNVALASRFGILELFKVIIEQKKYYLIPIPFEDLGNVFIPNVLTDKLDSLNISFFHSHNSLYYFSSGQFLAGLLIIFLTIIVFLKYAKKEPLLTRLLVLALGWVLANFIVFYLRDPYYTLPTVHRYYTYSLVGVALYWSILLFLIAQNLKKPYIFNLIIFAIIVNLTLGFIYERDFNRSRSTPAKIFFSSFNAYLPVLHPNSVLYFDFENNNIIKNRFSSYFGGMLPEEANFALYNPKIVYSSIKVVDNFDQLAQRLKSGQNKLDDVYSFYYGSAGLQNTTNQTRQILATGKVLNLSLNNLTANTHYDLTTQNFKTQTEIKLFNSVNVGTNPTIAISLPSNTPAFSPGKLKFSLMVSPETIQVPFQMSENFTSSIDSKTTIKVFNYLTALDQYRKQATVKTGSFWMDEVPLNVKDGKLTTYWRGNRIYWDDISRGATKDREFVELDLKTLHSISGISWVTVQKPLIPTDYSIYTSLDGNNWSLAKHVERYQTFTEGTNIRDTFDSVEARFIKMYVDKTFGNDGPEIAEIEPIESLYQSLDPKAVDQIRVSPFANIQTAEELRAALEYIHNQAVLNVSWQSDADLNADSRKVQTIPLQLDGQYHQYEILIPPNGLRLTKLQLSTFNFPASISMKGLSIVYETI